MFPSSIFQSILGPYIHNLLPSFPSILGPYIHPCTISNSSTSSPHVPNKVQHKHTSLNSFQFTIHISSINSPYHLSSCTHNVADGRKLDAKNKGNKAKYPHKSKDQHVTSKRHIQENKNVIQRKGKAKRP